MIGQNFEVNIGYKPDFVMLLFDDLTFNIMYSRDFSSTTYRICYTSQPTYDVNLGNFPVYNYVRFDITDTGFYYWRNYNSSLIGKYVAGKY